jgi:hypothetical protein
VWNCHSEDKHSIIIGMLIPSTTKYINMCSILFNVPFYLIIYYFSISSIDAPAIYHLRGVVRRFVIGNDVTGNDLAGNDVKGTGN